MMTRAQQAGVVRDYEGTHRGPRDSSTWGEAPGPFTVISRHTESSGNQIAATIMDFAPGANIPTFGTC